MRHAVRLIPEVRCYFSCICQSSPFLCLCDSGPTPRLHRFAAKLRDSLAWYRNVPYCRPTPEVVLIVIGAWRSGPWRCLRPPH
ncbi:hypothetical protein KC19_2G115900 [Ceratodon purpureus]|uniref:Uncharacterized protein n=1 Tax=Ceratodon purpureus TaxID=3225 RepID=A0A8T0IWP2_CERPU|nr:hypothetical protein KC19_2G115900 [Ceratodon purpureus]